MLQDLGLLSGIRPIRTLLWCLDGSYSKVNSLVVSKALVGPETAKKTLWVTLSIKRRHCCDLELMAEFPPSSIIDPTRYDRPVVVVVVVVVVKLYMKHGESPVKLQKVKTLYNWFTRLPSGNPIDQIPA